MTTPNNPYQPGQPQQPYGTGYGNETTPTYGTPSPYAPSYDSAGVPGTGSATPVFQPTEESFRGTDESGAADKAKAAADEAKGVAQEAGEKAKDLAGTAKDEAANVKDTAVAVGTDVVDTAKDQIAEVAGEAKAQGKQILDEGIAQLREQVGTGQGKIAEIVRGLTGEVEDLLNGRPQQGGAIHSLAGNVQSLGDKAASALENKDVEDLIDDVRRYAARKPMTFLAASAGLGFLTARLVRGLQGAASDDADRRQLTQRRLAQYDAPRYDTPQYRTQQGQQYTTGYDQGVDPQQNLVTGRYTTGYEGDVARQDVPNNPLDGLR